MPIPEKQSPNFQELEEPEKLETESLGPKKFLSFRKKKAEELNNEICGPYYIGKLNTEDIKKRLSLSQEETQIVQYVLESFQHPRKPDKLKRKDGSYIAVHSLQLFLTARDFYKIEDPQILTTLLMHDIVEDTDTTLKNITDKFGKKTAELVGVMTEQRGEEKANADRVKEVVDFATQIRRGGRVSAISEVIDRMDDIADLTYLLNRLEKKPDDTPLRDQVREKLLAKFGKCSYIVRKVAEVVEQPEQKIVADFEQLLEHRLVEIKSFYGITIVHKEIESEIKKYSGLEIHNPKFSEPLPKFKNRRIAWADKSGILNEKRFALSRNPETRKRLKILRKVYSELKQKYGDKIVAMTIGGSHTKGYAEKGSDFDGMLFIDLQKALIHYQKSLNILASEDLYEVVSMVYKKIQKALASAFNDHGISNPKDYEHLMVQGLDKKEIVKFLQSEDEDLWTAPEIVGMFSLSLDRKINDFRAVVINELKRQLDGKRKWEAIMRMLGKLESLSVEEFNWSNDIEIIEYVGPSSIPQRHKKLYPSLKEASKYFLGKSK